MVARHFWNQKTSEVNALFNGHFKRDPLDTIENSKGLAATGRVRNEALGNFLKKASNCSSIKNIFEITLPPHEALLRSADPLMYLHATDVKSRWD